MISYPESVVKPMRICGSLERKECGANKPGLVPQAKIFQLR